MIELGSRIRKYPPPPHVLWETLSKPRREGSRVWLNLEPGEHWPKIIESKKPALVVWSSFWSSRPRDTLRFEIEPDEMGGSRLHWFMLTPNDQPDEATLGRMRYRVNFLLGEMRASFGQ